MYPINIQMSLDSRYIACRPISLIVRYDPPVEIWLFDTRCSARSDATKVVLPRSSKFRMTFPKIWTKKQSVIINLTD